MIITWAARRAKWCRNILAQGQKTALSALLTVFGSLWTLPQKYHHTSEFAHVLAKWTAVGMSRFWRVAVAAVLLASIGSFGNGKPVTLAASSRDETKGWSTPGPQRALSGVLQPGLVVHAQTGPLTPAPVPVSESASCASAGRNPERQMAASGHTLRRGFPLREGAPPGSDEALVPDTSSWLGAPLPGPEHNLAPPPGDPRRLTLFRNTTVPVTTGDQITITEPSTDQLGQGIFATGNHHAEFSRDNGQTWQGLNPYTIFGPNFCCDQVTISDPQYHLQDWVLQYIPFFWGGGRGGGHLVLANSPVGDFVNWRPYTITPSDVGYANDQTNLDYNDLVVGNRYLYLTTRVITFRPDATYDINALVLMRISRADLAAGRPAHYDAIARTDITDDVRVPQGITDVAYAAAIALSNGEGQGRVMRLLVWPEQSMWVTTVDQRVPPFRYMTPDEPGMKGDCGSRDQVVANWCSLLTSGQLFAARGGGYLWFSWTAQQYGTRRPFPYVRITGIREADLRVAYSHDLYSLTVAHAYQAIATDARGHLGLIDTYGGGTGTTDYFPGAMIAIFDDISPASPAVDYFLVGKGNSCISKPDTPYDGDWGDYLTIRRWHAGGGVWMATAFARKDNTQVSCPQQVPMTIKNIVFGRERDRRFYERAVHR